MQFHFNSNLCFSLLLLVIFLLLVWRKLSMVPEGDDDWVRTVLLNVLSYTIIIGPVVIVAKYSSKWQHYLRKDHPKIWSFLVWLVGDPENAREAPAKSVGGHGHGHGADSDGDWCNFGMLLRLMVCIVGLQLSFLSWGVLQERMVTLSYGSEGKKFKDSVFLVFGNRSLAFLIAVAVVWYRKHFLTSSSASQPISNVHQDIPFYCYLYASFSNIMATWFQYEALKFVSFPLQVLSKTLKIIAVMILGRFVQSKTFKLSQYVLAGCVTLGVTMFLFGNESVKRSEDGSEFHIPVSGLILIVCYLFFDAFTSNWEERLFRQYPSIDSYDMMMGINCWGTLLTTTALVAQGGFVDAYAFMQESKEFAFHVLLLAISSAVGSLFIYYTIATFGAVVFVTIMTVRQALAILLSCIIYGHVITIWGFIGLMIVFASLAVKIYLQRQNTKKKQATELQQRLLQPANDSEDSLALNDSGNNSSRPLKA